MSRSRLVTGAQVILYVNNRPYAAVTGFRWDSSTPPKAIPGLDNGSPYELAPATTRISGSIRLLRQVGTGGIEGAGIVPQFNLLPRAKYFTLALVERSTDTQLFRADRCWVTSQSWDTPSKGRMEGSLSFEALDWNNETASR